jgi:hypothetical protein
MLGFAQDSLVVLRREAAPARRFLWSPIERSLAPLRPAPGREQDPIIEIARAFVRSTYAVAVRIEPMPTEIRPRQEC